MCMVGTVCVCQGLAGCLRLSQQQTGKADWLLPNSSGILFEVQLVFILYKLIGCIFPFVFPSQMSPRLRAPPRILTSPPRSTSSTPHTPAAPCCPSNSQGQHNYAVLETTRVMANTFRRVDSCGVLDSKNGTGSHTPSMTVEDPDTLANGHMQQVANYDKMRRTKSTGSASWKREANLKSTSPPALGRRTSPLVNNQQQQEQQPVYHILQQEPTGSTYQVLQQQEPTSPYQVPTSPTYHVLQQPQPGCQPGHSHFQHEAFQPFSEQVSSNAASSLHRPASTGPHNRYRINSSGSAWDRTQGPGHTHSPRPPPTFRSIASEVSQARSGTVPADFRTESLVQQCNSCCPFTSLHGSRATKHHLYVNAATIRN